MFDDMPPLSRRPGMMTFELAVLALCALASWGRWRGHDYPPSMIAVSVLLPLTIGITVVRPYIHRLQEEAKVPDAKLRAPVPAAESPGLGHA
jgi:hypothetical protein